MPPDTVRALFARLEHQKTEMLAGLECWPPDLLTRQPEAEAWCAVQVLDHLVRTETGITARARLGLADPHPVGVRDRMGVALLDRVFRSEHRVKVPAGATTVLPAVCPSLLSVLERWERGRRELQGVLAAPEVATVQDGVFRHPVAGWMTFEQVLQFFSVHMIHHGYQLRRIHGALHKTPAATSQWH
jgi:hypothetical protein